jgi:hypothetical protein
MSYIANITKTKEFRKLSQDEKLILLYHAAISTACGTVVADPEADDFVLRTEDSEKSLLQLHKKGIIFFDEKLLELFFINYLRFHNPTNSTVPHKIKYKADFVAIKSEKVKAVVVKALDEARKIAEKPQAQAQPSSHRVDY